MRDKEILWHVPGGRRGDTCDHGFAQKTAEGKTSYELGWKVKVMMKTNKII